MANRLNAGDKIHLQEYFARNVDGKVKLRKVKMMVAGQKFDSNINMCGDTHSAHDINFFLDMSRNHPETVCKKCEKKLKRIVNEAA